MTYPEKTVGMHAPSSSSHAICVQSMEDCLRTEPTKPAKIISCTIWYSSTPLRSSSCLWTSMEDTGLIKLHEPSPTPCLYVAPVQNMAGRVPLIPLFLAGNSTPTIPHLYSMRRDSGFPMGCADSAAVDGRRGSNSNVYEVSQWLWQFGRGKPRLGGLTVEETAERKDAARDERNKSGLETLLRRKADRA